MCGPTLGGHSSEMLLLSDQNSLTQDSNFNVDAVSSLDRYRDANRVVFLMSKQ